MEYLIFNSFQVFLIAGIIIFLGQVIYAALGFGSAMVSITLLSLVFGDLSQIIPYFLLLCIPTEIAIVYKNRKTIDFSFVKKFVLFLFAGLLIGSYLLKNAVPEKLVIYLGITISIIALYFLFFEKKLAFSFKKNGFAGKILSFITGILGGVYGISGPPIIIFLKGLKLNKSEFRATILSIFFSMSILRTVIYTFLGLYNIKILLTAIFTFPFVMLGLYLGNKIHLTFSETKFKKITAAVLLINGLILVIKNLT
ncbi:conserved hypothetical protein [Thermotomaculum hydrothermale]|uniref:Probable membrane transporter protein n=1 Tax=Thermotomaculum hydrothermale TaxID=981385 RepID=A0A7R6PZL1_9BACT|nr:sulfite exporter TauE/SafE family protein [Thermotomaculum hydrothermale]BBB32683.1 conserved hypothetical protein [Thermotomaculum hydrothermale]